MARQQQTPPDRQAPRDGEGRIDLCAFDRAGLAAVLSEAIGADEGASRRIFKQIWQRGVGSVREMANVRREILDRLDPVAEIPRLNAELVLTSADGTTKFLWRLPDGHAIESVLIPSDGDGRLTLCVSTQVGCAMACTFCLTGDLGLVRHLTASEIALQPLQVQATLPPGTRITNIVLMGMGEPLHNLKNLLPALSIWLDDDGLVLSHRRVTVSTVGLVPKMAELAAALPVNLAVSLNATTEAQRRQIMPITARYSMAELLAACRAFPLPHAKRITFEYVMFAEFNDTLDDAERLFALLDGIPAKVNLIPYNENPDRPALRRPSDETVLAFQNLLVRRGLSTSVRTTRGLDISAACGQLGKAREQVDRGLVTRS
ncbi:MAG: 23S rRNA (adenine(2503)-C(2))-methyltransferase RlmN [Myxococcota bacterium]